MVYRSDYLYITGMAWCLGATIATIFVSMAADPFNKEQQILNLFKNP